MMTKTSLKDARCIDFTRDADGFLQFPAFGERVVSFVREGKGSQVLVVVDRGYMMRQETPHVVRDHLNLTGTNPLVGPNDPCGERFPSVNGVYVTDVLPDLPRGVAAGLKGGVFPTREEMDFLASMGADFCCYNLVPTMIVAAHAGFKVLGVVAPDGADLTALLKAVRED